MSASSTPTRAPSSARVTKSFVEFRGGGGKSLEISAQRDAAGGWCGAYVHFFENFNPDPEYLDISTYSHLSFWVKGNEGGETFLVKIADQRWIELEDSVSIGTVTDFLASGAITTEW